MSSIFRKAKRDRAGWRRGLRRAGVALVLLAVAGVLLSTWIRDRWAILASLYYAVPLIFFVVVGLVGMALWRPRKRILLVGVLGWSVVAWTWYQASYQPSRETGAEAEAIRVVLWNVFSFQAGTVTVGEALREHDPDIVAMVEANFFYPEEETKLSRALDGMTLASFPGGLALAVRGEILERWDGVLTERAGAYALVQARVDEQVLAVLVVDLPSTPWESRKEPLRRLAELVEMLPYRNLVVVGDFNTPSGSVHFDRLRESLQEAYVVAGEGWRGTWPTRFPFLDLDQAWGSYPTHIVRLWHVNRPYSDHEMVLLDVLPAERGG